VATGGAARSGASCAGITLRARELTIALVAASGEKLGDLLAVAGRAGNFLVSEDQDLEFLVAFLTVVFKNRHVTHS
jgi:hypothetical protein